MAAALLALAFAANLAYALTSFGNGILYQCGFSLLQLLALAPADVPIAQITADLTMLMTPSRLWQAVRLRGAFESRLGGALIVFQTIGVWPGAFLVQLLDVRILRIVMGATFLCGAAGKAYTMRRKDGPSAVTELDLSLRAHAILLASTATFAGLLGGMFNTSGPPLMCFLLYFHVDAAQWRASYGVCQAIITLQQFYIFFIIGPFFNGSRIFEYLGLIGAGILGLHVGNVIVEKSTQRAQRALQWGALIFLVIGAIQLLVLPAPHLYRAQLSPPPSATL